MARHLADGIATSRRSTSSGVSTAASRRAALRRGSLLHDSRPAKHVRVQEPQGRRVHVVGDRVELLVLDEVQEEFPYLTPAEGRGGRRVMPLEPIDAALVGQTGVEGRSA